jgi:carbamoyl-phosphate synthase small subunit
VSRDWARERERSDFLALEDGTVYRGHSVGAGADALGEVVFNTGMTGYQEILTDPSYAGQLVTMTYPEIGNVGTNPQDPESRRVFANGFLVREINEPSNWRSTATLRETLAASGIPALAGVDTRALTTKLRSRGTQKGYLSVEGKVGTEAAVRAAREWCGLDNQDYAVRVSCDAAYRWDPEGERTRSYGVATSLPEPDLRIVAYDFGIKWNILRILRASGMDVTVVPAGTGAEQVLERRPDGVFFSNGPADPAAVTYAVRAARELLGRVPLMGICLGHQLFGIALGGRTFRLKFGHHGCNHPVRDLKSGAVEITTQNHNYAVDPDSLDRSVAEVTHVNLNDGTVEGLAHRTEPFFSVQYHPEAGPGPHDPRHLFARFRKLIGRQ